MSTNKTVKARNKEIANESDSKPSIKKSITKIKKIDKVSKNISSTDISKLIESDNSIAHSKLDSKHVELAKSTDKKKIHHLKSKAFLSKLIISISAGIILLMVLTAAAWQWTISTPEYGYYKIYQAIKSKDYDGLVKYTDTARMADGVTKDQEVFFQGQQTDINSVKFELKGKIEYTLNKMMGDGSLIDILPYKANNLQDIFKNKSLKKDGKTNFVIDFDKSDKIENGEGIGGYKTAIFEYKSGKWTFVSLKNNPTLENQKSQFVESQSTRKQNSAD